MGIHDPIDTEYAAIAAAQRVARNTGLELRREERPTRPRELGRAYSVLSVHTLRGSLMGMDVSLQLTHANFSGMPELFGTADVWLGPLWLDIQVVGRTTPDMFFFGDDRPLAALESEFQVRCEDDPYLVALLGGEIAESLVSSNQAGLKPYFDHERLHISAPALSALGAENLVRQTTRLGSAIEAKRRSIARPTRHRNIVAALTEVAQAWEGRLDQDRLELVVGSAEGRLTLIVEQSEFEKWQTTLHLELERPLGVTLSVAPVRRFYELWFQPDIKTGDAAFDRRFAVRGEPEDRVTRLLGEPQRRALEALVEVAGDVLVTERAVSSVLSGSVDDGVRARRLVDRMMDLGGKLLTQTSGQRAYR